MGNIVDFNHNVNMFYIYVYIYIHIYTQSKHKQLQIRSLEERDANGESSCNSHAERSERFPSAHEPWSSGPLLYGIVCWS